MQEQAHPHSTGTLQATGLGDSHPLSLDNPQTIREPQPHNSSLDSAARRIPYINVEKAAIWKD